METCDRCNNFIARKPFRGRRKDGSPATLCADCVAEIKGGSGQKKPISEKAVLPSSSTDKNKRQAQKSDGKWYKNIGYGVLCLGIAILVAYQLNSLETGTVSSVRLWWPIIFLYRTLGFWGAISCPSILALLFFGLGIKGLIAEETTD